MADLHLEYYYLTPNDKAAFDYIWHQLCMAFPSNELRSRSQQLAAMANSKMSNIMAFDGDDLVAFISFWTFREFIYIEHFLVMPSYQGKGVGTQVFETVQRQVTLPIVLEVEPPDNATSEARIRFYERLGLILWPQTYLQPPYHDGEAPTPMRLMASPSLRPDKYYGRVCTCLYSLPYTYTDVSRK